MTIDRIHTNLSNLRSSDLFRTVPAQPITKPTPVDMPGVLDQTRRLYRPYTGSVNKDQK